MQVNKNKKPILIKADEIGRISVFCEDTDLDVYLLDHRFCKKDEPPNLFKKSVEKLNVDLIAKSSKQK